MKITNRCSYFELIVLLFTLCSVSPLWADDNGSKTKKEDRIERGKEAPEEKGDENQKNGKTPVKKEPASVWIWTFSRLPEVYKNNDLFVKAVELAAKIAKSKAGQKAYSIVNKKNVPFSKKEVDKTGKHPEIEVVKVTGNKRFAWAFYEHPSFKYREDSIYWNKEKLDKILEIARKNNAKIKDISIFIAITILHETAHWKDQVIMGGTYRGEEGHDVNDLIFGKPHGDFDLDKQGCLTRGGKKLSDKLKDKWLNTATWK